MNLKCIIIDDESDAQLVLKLHCEKIGIIHVVGIASNAMEALELLSKNSVDFIFLDIEMPAINGFDFLILTSNCPKVIFTTAFSEFALQGYNYNVVDYLLKPISYDRFLMAINKMLRNHFNQEILASKELPLKEVFNVEINSIIYVESVGNYVKLHCNRKSHVVYSSLKEVEKVLIPYGFFRCHKSFIVNKNKIKNVKDSKSIELDSGVMIRIGISYKQQVKQYAK